MAESMQAQSKGGPSPEIFGSFFVAAGLAFFLLGQALSIALILPARFFKQRKYYLFSFILACLACVCFPFGTILGVLTIIMLARPAVKEIYGRVSKRHSCRFTDRRRDRIKRQECRFYPSSSSRSGMWLKAMRIGAASLQRCA